MSDRLPEPHGKWIDRERPVSFRFEGRPYWGLAGDCISSALWACGCRVLGRSFKYHRARGVWGLANTDSNVMLESKTRTNIRGDVTPIVSDLDVRAVNTVGGVENDQRRFLGWFSRFTPVGFYYKAFHTPKRLFPFYEKQLRKTAGLGKVNTEKTIEHTPKNYAFCDVLVVGAGPAGLSAAISAAQNGALVMLVDELPQSGGSLQYQHAGDADAQTTLEHLCRQVEMNVNIEYRPATVVASHDADNWIALVDEKRLTKLRAGAVIHATGCWEQPCVFRNNDLPGVMLASAAQRLIHLFAVKPFARAVAVVANAEGYRAVLDLLNAGVNVAAVADLRPDGEPGPLGQTVEEAGVVVRKGWTVYEAIPTAGTRGVSGVVLAEIDDQGVVHPEQGETINCDGVVTSVGWAPADGLLRQAKTEMAYAPDLEQFVPAALPDGVYAAGRVNGIFALEAQLADGTAAGQEAAAYLDIGEVVAMRPGRSGPAPSHAYPIFKHPKGKCFIDLDEDVQLKDLLNAIQEGYDHIELLKRYAAVGMGPSQGKHSNLTALRVLSRAKGEELEGRRVSKARPFAVPVPMSHLAGRIFTPRRRTPTHYRHETAKAKLMCAGQWLRPEYYPQSGKTREQCIYDEAKNVRENAGIIDLGTLGKLDVSGPDAVTFLEQMYTGKFANLKTGMCRYGAMTDESSIVIDDGIIARLAEDRFYVSTTTGGAADVFREMQRWALQWELDVVIVNATDQYGALNIAGPKSRDILSKVTDLDLSAEALPYMGFREALVAGVPARVSRVGFVSDLGYEVHAPVDGFAAIWDVLMAAGASDGIRPFGVEAQRLLRLEMGRIIVGRDSDALTHPFHVNMAWALEMDKPFFVGQRSIRVVKEKDLERQLVGFTLPEGYSGTLPEDNHQIIEGGEIAGRVTSVANSPTLRRPIGMAFLKPALAEPGTAIQIRLTDGTMVEGEVADLPFYKANFKT